MSALTRTQRMLGHYGRRMGIGCVALMVATVAAACGGKADDDATSAGADNAAYPVTIEHKLGKAVIDKAPARIVTLSDADLDALLLLGIQPVGIAESSGPDGISPWAKPKLTSKPTVLKPGDNGYQVEEVLALKPDLILAGGNYYIKDQYEKYAAQIPTTGYEKGNFEDSWQVTLRQVAKAVGKTDAGEKIVKDVEAKIASVKTDHPALAGKKFAVSQVWEAGSVGVLRSKEDAGVKMLNDFGMVLAPSVAELPGEEFAAQLSLEKVGVLDSDVLLVYYTEDTFKATLEANTLFKNMKVVQRKAYVALTKEQFSALRTATPLSVPFLIDNAVPDIVKAATAQA